MVLWLFMFFFQAEDGIRDYKVTGLQTCALPIYLRSGDADAELRVGRAPAGAHQSLRRHAGARRGGEPAAGNRRRREIGRASCRERGETEEADGAQKRKQAQIAQRPSE